MHISNAGPAMGNVAERADIAGHGLSQHHPSNWVDAGEEEDEGDEAELCVHSTPPYHEE